MPIYKNLEEFYKASSISKTVGTPSRPTPAKPTPALVPTRPTPEKPTITPVNDEPIVHQILPPKGPPKKLTPANKSLS